jgi:Cof subfamily protein (haloacid dehalogenase superfamily)
MTNQTWKGIAFFDLDGTLYNDNKTIDLEVVDAINTIRDNGILPMLATGRANYEISEVFKASGINSAVTYNGQSVIIEDQVVYMEPIDKSAMTKLVDYAESQGDTVGFLGDRGFWAMGRTEETLILYGTLGIIDRERYLREDVYMLHALYQDASRDEAYKAAVPELNFFRNSPLGLDVVAAGHDKGTGVAKVLELLDLDVPTYGFGDGLNDIALLSGTTYGIAMGNGVPELKAIADYVTAANTEGGLIQAFKHYGWL